MLAVYKRHKINLGSQEVTAFPVFLNSMATINYILSTVPLWINFSALSGKIKLES